MKILGIKYMLMAQDMQRALAFYRDVMGLEVKQSSPFWSELAQGDAVVALHGGGSGAFRDSGLSFTVADIRAACAAVAAGGGKIRSAPQDRGDEGITLAELTDTEGNGFMMSQPKA